MILRSPAELTRLYGDRFDNAAAILQLEGYDCDCGGIGAATFALTPAAGEVLHSLENAQGGCSLSPASTSTDDYCSAAFAFKVPAGAYTASFTDPGGRGLSVPVEVTSGTWTTVSITAR